MIDKENYIMGAHKETTLETSATTSTKALVDLPTRGKTLLLAKRKPND